MARLWIVTYDIADDRRLRRVAQLLEQPHEDQVRYYRLCASDGADVRVDGVGALPQAHRYTVC